MVKNILMISIDNLRFDCVGFQPFQKELEDHGVLKHLHTPMLDAIAEKSLCFTQCMSTNSYTTSAHASILTGLYPPRHGVRAFFETKLSSDVQTITEVLRRNGYRTILYSDFPDLFVPLDLSRGFEFRLSRDDGRLLQLLEELQGEKIFLFVHFFDVHEPFLHNTSEFPDGSNNDYMDEMSMLYNQYGIAGSFDARENGYSVWNRLLRGPLSDRPIDILLPLYIKGITKFDSGRFSAFMDGLSGMNFIDDALIAIFSDHGEGRCFSGNQTYFHHAGELFDNVLRVPLLISHPGLESGRTDRLMSIVDIAPTLLGMLQITDLTDIDGINILSQKKESCYAEIWKMSELVSVDPHGSFVSETGMRPESVFVQMALRTDKSKYLVWNRDDLDQLRNHDSQEIPDDEFVKMLYRSILGRLAEPEGLLYHVRLLENGEFSKADLVKHFLQLEEYKNRPVDVRYDLVNDPEEDLPIEMMGEEDLSNIAAARTISSKSVLTTNIYDDKQIYAHGGEDGAYASKAEGRSEEQEIISRLSDLGYF